MISDKCYLLKIVCFRKLFRNTLSYVRAIHNGIYYKNRKFLIFFTFKKFFMCGFKRPGSNVRGFKRPGSNVRGFKHPGSNVRVRMSTVQSSGHQNHAISWLIAYLIIQFECHSIRECPSYRMVPKFENWLILREVMAKIFEIIEANVFK